MSHNRKPPCRIYLHPAAATSPKAVEAITRRTGLALVVPSRFATAQLVDQPRPSGNGPYGGDAA